MCVAEEMVTTTIGWFVYEKLKALRLHYKPHILFIQSSRWTMFIRLPLWNMVTFNHKSVKIIISTCLFCLVFSLSSFPFACFMLSISLSIVGRSQLEIFYRTEMLLHRDLSSRCQQQVLNICLCAQMCVRFVSKRKTKTPACSMAPKKEPSLIITFKRSMQWIACTSMPQQNQILSLSLLDRAQIGARLCQRHHGNVNVSCVYMFQGEFRIRVKGKAFQTKTKNCFRKSNDLH